MFHVNLILTQTYRYNMKEVLVSKELQIHVYLKEAINDNIGFIKSAIESVFDAFLDTSI